MIAIGIDPGLTGALAKIDNGALIDVRELPTVENGSTGRFKRWADPVGLDAVLRSWIEGHDKTEIFVALERPIAMPGQDSGSTAVAFDTFGVIRGALGARGLNTQIIVPQRWKNYFGLKFEKGTKDAAVKRASIDMALRLYPASPLSRAGHHNRAESILIARWLWMVTN